MKKEQIATATDQIHKYLIQLAIDGKLDGDITLLNTEPISEIIRKASLTEKQLTSEVNKPYQRAGELLSTSEFSAEEQVKTIEKFLSEGGDENTLIDHIEDVDVWEKVELEFTVKEFLEQIK